MTHDDYMRMALAEAQKAMDAGEVPVGAVIVKDGAVIASAHNQVETLSDGTAHAELLALQRASEHIGDWRLDGCLLYVTKEPCPMCIGAAVNCRIAHLIFGCPDTRTGGPQTLAIAQMPNALHQVEITSGILEEDCRNILKEFFRNRRCAASDSCNGVSLILLT